MSEDNKKFYKTMLILCVPIIIQILITNSLNIVDTIMVSSLGESSVAAIGIANQYFFLFLMIIGGLASGAGIFISQFFGKGDTDGIKKVTSISLVISVLIGIIFLVVALFFPTFITGFFTHDKDVVNQCKMYLKYISLSYPLTCISYIFATSSRSVRNPKLGMISSLIAISINIIINYVLIFGNFGFPALGVLGSAIGTLIARIIELSIILIYIYVYKKDYCIKFSLKALKSVDSKFLNYFIVKSMPVLINDGIWALGTVMYSVAYARAGTTGIAISQIAITVQNFFVIVSVCMAIGGSIMIGNELGSNNKKLAVEYAKKFAVLITIVGTIFGILLYASTPILLNVFNVENHLIKEMKKIFIIMGFFMGIRALNTFIVVGILRSGGDTKYALFLEAGCMWFFSIPITFIAAYKGFPIHILVLMSYSEEIIKFVFGVPRVLSKKWVTNIVNEV